MITFISHIRNISSQSQYDSEVARISSSIHSFPCPCCGSTSLVFNGHYPRRLCVTYLFDFLLINVQRVYCKHCGRSHALIPDIWLARSPIPLSLLSDILHLSHSDFSAFQNTHYPLTDHFLYSFKRKFSSFLNTLDFSFSSFDDPLLLRYFLFSSPYQHTIDTFFFLDAI